MAMAAVYSTPIGTVAMAQGGVVDTVIAEEMKMALVRAMAPEMVNKGGVNGNDARG
jgi:hypothetical protein